MIFDHSGKGDNMMITLARATTSVWVQSGEHSDKVYNLMITFARGITYYHFDNGGNMRSL